MWEIEVIVCNKKTTQTTNYHDHCSCPEVDVTKSGNRYQRVKGGLVADETFHQLSAVGSKVRQPWIVADGGSVSCMSICPRTCQQYVWLDLSSDLWPTPLSFSCFSPYRSSNVSLPPYFLPHFWLLTLPIPPFTSTRANVQHHLYAEKMYVLEIQDCGSSRWWSLLKETNPLSKLYLLIWLAHVLDCKHCGHLCFSVLTLTQSQLSSIGSTIRWVEQILCQINSAP